MSEYNLFIICFISMIGIVIKADWVEIPQFSHDKKIYRTSLKLDRFNQFYHNEREEFTSTVRYDIQNTSKFQQVSEIKKTGYQKRPDSSFMGYSTISSLDTSGYFQESAVTVTNSQNINLEENEESFGNYYYDEYKVEDEAYVRFLYYCYFSCPWRKFRIEIHSEPIRNFPNHSGTCIRTKQFHSDLIRRSFSIRINPRPIRKINPNESVQSELSI